MQTLALQIQVGTPLQLALRSSTKVVSADSPLSQAAAEREERLQAGLELHCNLAATGLFPPLVLGMVRVGQKKS